MSRSPSDDAFARFVKQSLMATDGQIDAARNMQLVSSELSAPLSLAEVLVQQGVITPAQREAVELKLNKEKESAGKVGPYKIIRKVGEGGMGGVYLAEDPKGGPPLALKVLHKKHLSDSDFVSRFRRESQAAIQLNHPNIARAYSVGEERGHPYYVMEYCEGETLKQTLVRLGAFEPLKATRIIIQIAQGLKYAHDLGFIHRDIKPDNIIDNPDGVAKILDLGLTKNIEDVEQSFRTVSSVAIGTPHYIAPEQARNEKAIDGRADIYSLGATFYHVVTGETPFHGSSSYEIITKHLTEQLPDPRDIREEIPDGVVEVIRKMMAKKPAHRYQDCSALLKDLELIVAGSAPASGSLDAALSSIALPRARRKIGVRKPVPAGGPAPETKKTKLPDAFPFKQYAIFGAAAGAGLAVVVVALLKMTSGRPVPQDPVVAAPAPLLVPAPQSPVVPVRPPAPKLAPVEELTPIKPVDVKEARAHQRFFEIQEMEKSGRKSPAELRGLYEGFISEFEGTATAASAADWLKAAAPEPLRPAEPDLPFPAPSPGLEVSIPVPDFGETAWARAPSLLETGKPARDVKGGTWKDGRLKSIGAINARVDLSYQPPEEYDIRLVFTRIQGSEVALILPLGSEGVVWVMGGLSNTIFGFESLRGIRASENATTVRRARCLEDGRSYTAIVQVRKSGLAAYLDGRLVTSLPAGFSQLTVPRDWALSEGNQVGIGVSGSVEFTKIEVLEVRGRGVSRNPETPLPTAKPMPPLPALRPSPESVPKEKDFKTLEAEAQKSVWLALVEKKAALLKQPVLLNKPGLGETQYSVKDLTRTTLVLELQFGGGLVESVERVETLPIGVFSTLLQKAGIHTSPEMRKALSLLWAGAGSFEFAYRELGKARTEGANVDDVVLMIAREELGRSAGKKTLQERMVALKTLAAQRASSWPDSVRRQLDQEITTGEKEVQRSEGPLGLRLADRATTLQRGGGSAATDQAVLNALKWLARHQSSDGRWASENFSAKCVGETCGGPGTYGCDTGLTGLSLLVFLGAGYTPLSKEMIEDNVQPSQLVSFGEVVKKGLKFLIDRQDPEGCLAERNSKYMYNHLIATLALVEAYAMTGTGALRDPAQKAVDFTVAAQNPGKGWRYSAKCGDNDTSVCGWGVAALKSAETAELSFPKSAYEGALTWLDEATEQNGYYPVGYNAAKTGKVYIPKKNEQFDHHPCMSAVAVASRIFIRKRRSDPVLGAVNLLVSDLPEWKTNKIDYYYWYYGSMALFQYDGPDGPMWRKWNEPMKNALVPNQHRISHGCKNGSWDPENERWGMEGGRVYATALNALTLESYYRYSTGLPLKVK